MHEHKNKLDSPLQINKCTFFNNITETSNIKIRTGDVTTSNKADFRNYYS